MKMKRGPYLTEFDCEELLKEGQINALTYLDQHKVRRDDYRYRGANLAIRCVFLGLRLALARQRLSPVEAVFKTPEKPEKPETRLIQVGDVISFTLKDGEPVKALAVKQVYDNMYFCFVDCLKDEYPLMESTRNGYPGWHDSDLRRVLNTEILDRFPDKLRNKMKMVYMDDLLRIPTEKEIFGENKYAKEKEGWTEQFEPMKDRRNRIAFQGLNGDAEWYWLQDQVEGYATGACIVNDDGLAGSTSASASFGVRPLFQLSRNPAASGGDITYTGERGCEWVFGEGGAATQGNTGASAHER